MTQTPLLAQGPVDVNVSRLLEENRILRYLLAMAHDGPKHRIYGDDGELQCSVCWIDFVRDSAQGIKRKIEEAGMRELQRAIEAGEWPPKTANASHEGQDGSGGTPL